MRRSNRTQISISINVILYVTHEQANQMYICNFTIDIGFTKCVYLSLVVLECLKNLKRVQKRIKKKKHNCSLKNNDQLLVK